MRSSNVDLICDLVRPPIVSIVLAAHRRGNGGIAGTQVRPKINWPSQIAPSITKSYSVEIPPPSLFDQVRGLSPLRLKTHQGPNFQGLTPTTPTKQNGKTRLVPIPPNTPPASPGHGKSIYSQPTTNKPLPPQPAPQPRLFLDLVCHSKRGGSNPHRNKLRPTAATRNIFGQLSFRSVCEGL